MKKDKAGFLTMPHTTEKLWKELTPPNVLGYVGFASYSLNNNGENIRQVKQRIEQVKRQEDFQSTSLLMALGFMRTGRLTVCK